MKRYYVYVIELDEGVRAHKKFRERNPFYIKGNGCMYVGQSSRKPKLRFDQHKEGYKSNKYAKVYGERLRPDLYEKYNPIPTRRDAEEIEKIAHDNKDMSYIDAIVYFCEQNNVDIESVPKLMSKPLKEKLKCEAMELNLLKKTSHAKLPL